jgi:hypothetical protein
MGVVLSGGRGGEWGPQTSLAGAGLPPPADHEGSGRHAGASTPLGHRADARGEGKLPERGAGRLVRGERDCTLGTRGATEKGITPEAAAEIQHCHTERNARLQLGPLEDESIITEDPESALEASERALHTGSIRIEVGPVDWWLAGHATLLDDGCGPILVQTYVHGIAHALVVRGSNVGEPQVRVSVIQCPLVMRAIGRQCQDGHANTIGGHGKMQVER